uniref:Agouti domain-containing protein n=1 Tax=Hippocampus comes TaxID=109280 RepID=A0A3Q2YQ16_HIPCM
SSKRGLLSNCSSQMMTFTAKLAPGATPRTICWRFPNGRPAVRAFSRHHIELDRSRAPEAWHDPAQVDEDNNEERGDFLMEAESYDQDGSASRAMRSARRCIRHQQSCLGFPLPCCDACDTCYCRFFNAICYCRRVGHACPSART